MSRTWIDQYLEAWSEHCLGQQRYADGMCEAASEAIEYGDINLEAPFRGHAGVREMCALASQILPGALMRIEQRVVSDGQWVTRWRLEGRHAASGRDYSIRGCSWGTLDTDGRVRSQLDYWNPAHFTAQTGTALF